MKKITSIKVKSEVGKLFTTDTTDSISEYDISSGINNKISTYVINESPFKDGISFNQNGDKILGISHDDRMVYNYEVLNGTFNISNFNLLGSYSVKNHYYGLKAFFTVIDGNDVVGSTWVNRMGTGDGTLMGGVNLTDGDMDFNSGGRIGDYVNVVLNETVTVKTFDVWFYNYWDIIPDYWSGRVGDYQSMFQFNPNEVANYRYGGIHLNGFTELFTNESIHFWDNGMNDNGTFNGSAITTNIPGSSGWQNLVIVWNGTHYDFWLNGIKQSVFFGDNNPTTLLSLKEMNIGSALNYGTNTGRTYSFRGKINEVKIYDVSLTDEIILENYNKRLSLL